MARDAAGEHGIVGVFGATPDGRWLIGNVLSSPGSGGKDSCLARLDPLDSLRVVARACGLPAAIEWGTVSPDGHWLGYQTANEATGRTQTTLVDLTTVFQRQKVSGTWPLESPGNWIGPDTMVVQGLDERFYRYRVGQPTGEEVGVTGMPPGGKVILLEKLS